jgi:hypothetical protein
MIMKGFFYCLFAVRATAGQGAASMAEKTVDTNALRFNQIGIIVLVLAGFIFDIRIIPALVAAILLAGVLDGRLSIFRWVYRAVILPARLLTPQIVEDDGAAHRFAQLLGGLTLSAAAIALFIGSLTTGWILAWVVLALAGANLVFGFCTGCFLYFQIRKFRSARSAERAQEA